MTIPGKKMSLWAVYMKFTLFGNSGRAIDAAFPLRTQAMKWVNEKLKNGFKEGDFIIEQIDVTMKAWNPCK